MQNRLLSAIVISATILLTAGVTPASAFDGTDTDIPSDYSGEEFTDDLVIEDVPGDPEGWTTRGAAGSSPIETFQYQVGGLTISIPTGCALTHVIKGDGKRITNQMAGVDCVGPSALLAKFCNTRLEFHYANTAGKTYKIKRGPLNSPCRSGTVNSLNVAADHTLAHYGKACAQLFVNGKRRAVQCHYITS
ncbi:hypothetical protein [Streptomyces sp. DH12]|uniref:hypothetical protein n=1 Tax=Streptomyces sp. DH12 TaxID=2857010 RepID=UPI001E44BDA6|nr:hypothetical protein [Streptomyces sp. DH12]